MNILVLILFVIISPFATLYSLECSRHGSSHVADMKLLFSPTKFIQIFTYIFFAVSALVLFINSSNDLVALVLDCFVISLGYTAALTDIFCRRVPNKLVLVMLGTWIFFAMTRVFSDFGHGMESIIASMTGCLVGTGLMLIVYLVSRKGLGAGDVKFVGVLGLFLTYKLVLTVMLVGGVLCLISAIVLILVRKTKMNDAIPFIPFLYIGVILTIFLR